MYVKTSLSRSWSQHGPYEVPTTKSTGWPHLDNSQVHGVESSSWLRTVVEPVTAVRDMMEKITAAIPQLYRRSETEKLLVANEHHHWLSPSVTFTPVSARHAVSNIFVQEATSLELPVYASVAGSQHQSSISRKDKGETPAVRDPVSRRFFAAVFVRLHPEIAPFFLQKRSFHWRHAAQKATRSWSDLSFCYV